MVEIQGASCAIEAVIAITPKGDMLAGSFDFAHVGLWSTAGGSQKRTLDLEGSTPRALQFAPNGQILAIVVTIDYRQHHILLWDIFTDELKELHVSTGPIWDVVFLDEGKTLASAISATVVQWDTKTWRESFRFSLARQDELTDIESVVFSPNDARYVAIRLRDRAFRLFLTTTGKEVGHFNIKGTSQNLCFSPDGQYMASVPDRISGRRIYLWGVTLGIASRGVGDQNVPLENHSGNVYGMKFVPGADSPLHVIGSKKEIWNWTADGELSKRGLPPVHSFSPDGRFLVTLDKHRIQFWGPTMEGQPLKIFDMPAKNSIWKDVVFSPDAELVAIVDSSQTSIVQTSTWQSVSVFQWDSYGLVFSPIKDRVAWYSKGNETLHVWDLSKGAYLFQGIKVQVLKGDILLLSPNGECLSWTTDNYHVHLVKLETGQEKYASLQCPGVMEGILS